jgi:ATP-binding cassette subfamily B protein
MKIKRPQLSRFTTRNIRVMFRMLNVSWHIRRKAVAGFFGGALLETGSFIVSIYATARLAGLLAAFVSGGPTDDIWFWLWIDIAGAAGIGLGFWLMSFSRRLLYFRTVEWSTREFQTTLCRLDIHDFYDDETRNQLNKVQSGYTWQMANFGGMVLELLYALLRFVATAAVVAQITWWLIPLITIFLIPSLVAEQRLAKVTWFVWDSKGDQRHVFWGLEWLIRQAKNQMELRSSQARTYVLDKIDDMSRDFYRTQERQFSRGNRFMVPAKLLEVVGTALGSIVVLRQFLGGAISLDRYFFLSGALLRIGGALNNIFGTLSRMQESLLFAENYFDVINRQPTLVDKPAAPPLTGENSSVITFEHVTFTYPGQSKPVFKDLNFTIASGQHVAIVGENGAGKSTLIKLLLRFYRPDSGRILLDGQDLQNIAIESWYERLATLFQEFNQYPFSIAENIEIGRAGKHDDVRLKTAAKLSNVDSFVKNYTHGWDTVLDNSFEKGIEPSGGQWQRVALARAFYRQAQVLILDEPTAAIDAKAEYDIFNNIFKHHHNKTAIIVSHRFSTVRRADVIVVVDEGKIVEQGSHKQLMSQRGLYHELFTKQAEGYKD